MLFFLYIPMAYADTVTLLQQEFVNQFCKGDRTVFAARAADRYDQLAFALVDIERDRIADKIEHLFGKFL